MMATAHILTSAVIANKIFHLTEFSLGVAILGSLAPDIDNPKSVIGRIFFFLSWPLSILGHRTITHSITVGLSISTILIYLIQLKTGMSLVIPWLIGYTSHLLLDSLTKEGVQIFYPYPFFLSAHLIRTGGIVEFIYTIALTTITVAGVI